LERGGLLDGAAIAAQELGRSVPEHKPKLTTPSMVVLIQHPRPRVALSDPDRDATIDVMRIAG
jgi:hypothetical protein